MVWQPEDKLAKWTSFSSYKNELHAVIYFCDLNKHAIPLFTDRNILQSFSYYESLANLMYEVRHGIAPNGIQRLSCRMN